MLGQLGLEQHILGCLVLEQWVERCPMGLHVGWYIPSRTSKMMLTT